MFGPVAGLYGAILVGFFAAMFGGTPTQVSGPTGPMTVVMAAVVTQYAHDPAMAFTVVMLGEVAADRARAWPSASGIKLMINEACGCRQMTARSESTFRVRKHLFDRIDPALAD